MLKSIQKVSGFELELLTTMKKVGFGEIIGATIPEEELEYEEDVSQNQKDLLKLIRGGERDITVIVVHQGEPVAAEVDKKIGTIHCRQKHKFPTS